MSIFTEYADNHDRLPIHDVERNASWSTDSVEYFTVIFDLAKRERLLAPMLRGFITTASVGSELLVRNSRIALLDCLGGCSTNEISLFHDALVQIIRTEIPTVRLVKPTSEIPSGRLLRPVLEVLSFVLDNDAIPKLSTNPYQELLQPLRAVHANTDLPTLQALVGVYAGFLKHSDLHMAALVTLHRLLLHRYPAVRSNHLPLSFPLYRAVLISARSASRRLERLPWLSTTRD